MAGSEKLQVTRWSILSNFRVVGIETLSPWAWRSCNFRVFGDFDAISSQSVNLWLPSWHIWVSSRPLFPPSDRPCQPLPRGDAIGSTRFPHLWFKKGLKEEDLKIPEFSCPRSLFLSFLGMQKAQWLTYSIFGEPGVMPCAFNPCAFNPSIREAASFRSA